MIISNNNNNKHFRVNNPDRAHEKDIHFHVPFSLVYSSDWRINETRIENEEKLFERRTKHWWRLEMHEWHWVTCGVCVEYNYTSFKLSETNENNDVDAMWRMCSAQNHIGRYKSNRDRVRVRERKTEEGQKREGRGEWKDYDEPNPKRTWSTSHTKRLNACYEKQSKINDFMAFAISIATMIFWLRNTCICELVVGYDWKLPSFFWAFIFALFCISYSVDGFTRFELMDKYN